MMTPHSADEIVASITWHYSVTDTLDGPQLLAHKQRLACPECEDATPASRAERVLMVPADA